MKQSIFLTLLTAQPKLLVTNTKELIRLLYEHLQHLTDNQGFLSSSSSIVAYWLANPSSSTLRRRRCVTSEGAPFVESGSLPWEAVDFFPRKWAAALKNMIPSSFPLFLPFKYFSPCCMPCSRREKNDSWTGYKTGPIFGHRYKIIL